MSHECIHRTARWLKWTGFFYISALLTPVGFAQSLTATPGNNIQPYFSIAGNVTGSGGIEGLFNGQIDNVRLFSYNPHPSTLSVQVQAGQVLVNNQGTPGAGYTLWRTPMLQPTSWTVVTNGIADGTGRVTLTDPAPPATGSFYRTSAP